MSIHVGVRGPIYDRFDLSEDASFGFKVIRPVIWTCSASTAPSTSSAAGWVTPRSTCPSTSTYSILHSGPGAGKREMGGLTSCELLHLLRRVMVNAHQKTPVLATGNGPAATSA